MEKNFNKCGVPYGNFLQKLLLIMRLVLFILITTTLSLFATGTYSQSARVTVDLKNSSVRDVLSAIEKSSEFFFIYNNELVDVERKVDLQVKDQKISDILKKLFSPDEVEIAVVDRKIILAPAYMKSQQQKVTGTVTDASTGEPIIGANIIVEGTTLGVTTDVNGVFSIELSNANAVLVVSYIGYNTERITLSGQSKLEIGLVPDITKLEEVVVIGYGTQKKSDITGAISSISEADLQNVPAVNFLEQAQGKMAGVDIVRSSGTPGAGLQIRIRGNRSINASNDPLYVVDGIPTSLGLNDFNPNDIASMEVLKDASSVAIYGSRGANGVVLITTKKGKEGKAVISYDGYYGVKHAIQNLDVMNGQEFVEYFRVSRGLAPDDNSKDNLYLGSEEIDNYSKGISTNWLNEVLRPGLQQEHLISASGSGKGVVYYLSGGYYDEKGVLHDSDYKRYSVRTNIETQLTTKLKLGINATASSFTRNMMSNDPFRGAISYSPLTVPYDSAGNFVAYPNSREGLAANPLLDYQAGQHKNETKGYRLFSNLFAEYNLFKDLTYRINFGTDLNVTRNGQYTGTLAGSINEASVSNDMDFAYTIENILTYNKTINQHKLNVVGLFSTQKSKTETSGASGQDIPIEYSTFYDLGSATTVTGIGSSVTEWGLLSYMGRVNYQLKDRYLLTVSGRADGSSRLSEGSKWAFFPAAALGWIVSEEDFFNSSVISFLKLRSSYGEVGNTSIKPYQTLGALESSVYAFDEKPAFGYRLDEIPNPDLRWEISRTVNAGLDFRLLDGKFTGSFEYYVTNTKDLLLSRLIPVTSGYSSILQNVGSTRNSGWEFTGSAALVTSKTDFNWDMDFNVFSNKEEIVELFNGRDDDVGNRWFIGQPINVYYTHNQLGIWQTEEAEQAALAGQAPGDIKIQDVNGRDGEGNLTNQPDGVINSDDRMIIGSRVPKWSAGLTNNISFKGFDLSVQIYTRQGQTLQSDYHDVGGTNWQGRSNHIKLDYWTPSNPSNKYPVPKGGAVPLYAESVKFFDGSFTKLKNVTLGYNFTESIVKKAGLSSCRLYLTANNALIFSKFKVVDPESSSGVVGGGTPLNAATYIVGVNLKF